MFTKRIIAFVLSLSLLVVSALAAGNDVYLVEEDTGYLEVVDESEWYSYSDSAYANGGMSTFSSVDDYGIAPAAITSELQALVDIYDLLVWGFDTNLDSIWTRQGTMVELLKELETRVGVYYLYYDGSTSTTASATTLSDIVRYGFLGLGDKLDDVNSLLSAADTDHGTMISHLYNIYLQAVSIDTQLETLVDSVATESTLSALSSKVATESTLSSFSSLFSSRTLAPAGEWIIKSDGSVGQIESSWSIISFLNSSFQGIRRNVLDFNSDFDSSMSLLDSRVRIPSGVSWLTSSGLVDTSKSVVPLSEVLQYGLLGLRALIAGSESDNVYSGSITSNENIETSFNATGLGPMLNRYMDAIQNDTGMLSYMFASPADIQAKKDSESLTGEMADSFLKPDSDASIKLSDVGVLKDSSKTVQELGDTGVTPGLAFSQLTGNSDLFAFFSQETASDLDTTVMTLSDDPDHQIVTTYYEDSRAAFYELIGKGGDE